MARASSISKAGKGFSGQEQAANKPGAIQRMGDQTKRCLASSRKGGPRGNELSDVREHPSPEQGSKQPAPLGHGEAADSRDPGGGLQGGPG